MLYYIIFEAHQENQSRKGYLKLTQKPTDETVSRAVSQVADLNPEKGFLLGYAELTQEEYEKFSSQDLRKFGPPGITNVEIQKNKLN